jgi:hypothetical protein
MRVADVDLEAVSMRSLACRADTWPCSSISNDPSCPVQHRNGLRKYTRPWLPSTSSVCPWVASSGSGSLTNKTELTLLRRTLHFLVGPVWHRRLERQNLRKPQRRGLRIRRRQREVIDRYGHVARHTCFEADEPQPIS